MGVGMDQVSPDEAPCQKKKKKKHSIYFALQTFSLMKLNKSRVLPRTSDSHLCDVRHVATARLTPDLTAALQSITVPIRSDTGE